MLQDAATSAWAPILYGRIRPVSGALPEEHVQIHSCENAPQKNARILLVNLLQSSRSTFSWGGFLRFFVFFEGMLDTQISAPGGWPTVSARYLHTFPSVCLLLDSVYRNSFHLQCAHTPSLREVVGQSDGTPAPPHRYACNPNLGVPR